MQLSPAPIQQPMVQKTGTPTIIWSKWFQSIRTLLSNEDVGGGGIMDGGRRLTGSSLMDGGRRV